MKSLMDSHTRDELIIRVNALDESRIAQWGKMNVYQMAKHCTVWDEWVLGRKDTTGNKQHWLGKIIGRWALRQNTKDDRPMGKGYSAGKLFIITEKNGDLEEQKRQWIDGIRAYEHYNNPDFRHDFFGRMTPEQVGIFAYKHADHHLRQFGV